MNLREQIAFRLFLKDIKFQLRKSEIDIKSHIEEQGQQTNSKLQATSAAQEREKLAVAALLEDFKARWQELLNFENENNRWSTLYVTALMLVISWILNNNQYQGLSDLFHKGENSYFIISLALINAIYTLAMALKGYQIQQIALYLYEEVGSRITSITGQPFNSWERWRRESFQTPQRRGKPELIRVVYYFVISSLPVAVSTVILTLYGVYEWKRHGLIGGHNIYFYIVCIMVLGAMASAISTTSINKRWADVLAGTNKDTDDVKQLSESGS